MAAGCFPPNARALGESVQLPREGLLVIKIYSPLNLMWSDLQSKVNKAIPAGWSVVMFARQCLPSSGAFLSYTKLGGTPQNLFLALIIANQSRDASEAAVYRAKDAIKTFLSQNCTQDIQTYLTSPAVLKVSPMAAATPTPSASELALQRCYPNLVGYINFDSISPYLVQYELLSRGQQEELNEIQTTTRKKVEKVLHWLPKSQPDFLPKFIQCLKDSAESFSYHGDLAKEVQKAFEGFQSQTGTRNVTTVGQVERGTMVMHPPHINQEHGYFKTCTRKMSYRWLSCYLCLAVTILLLVCALAILASVPAAEDRVQPVQVYNTDTVELSFNLDTIWIDEITMTVVGRGCRGPVLVIEDTSCNEFSKTHAASDNLELRYANYIYMLPGSTIHFTIDSDVDTQVWIFSDFDSANAYTGNEDSYSCSDYPSGAFCFEASYFSNQTFDYKIERASYYFLRFRDSSGIGINWVFNRKIYDYENLLLSGYKPEVTLSADPQTIHLHPQPFRYATSCILLYIEEDSCPQYAEPHVTNMKRRQDVLVFPSVLLIVAISAIVVTAILCVYRTKCRPVLAQSA